LGVAIATVFYLLTSAAVVVALPWEDSAKSSRPLADAMTALFDGLAWPGDLGAAIMSIGALISIAGVYDVFTLGVARLSWAMSRDKLFPGPFARLSRGGTPWVGLTFQAVCGVAGVFLFDIRPLIEAAVLFLGLCYLITALAALRLLASAPTRSVHIPMLRPLLVLACVSGAYLSTQPPPQMLAVGVGAIVLGLAAFLVMRGPRGRVALWTDLGADERRLERVVTHRERWLVAFLRRAADDQ
jgi:APA family basic amino acid/polyamine antiporter